MQLVYTVPRMREALLAPDARISGIRARHARTYVQPPLRLLAGCDSLPHTLPWSQLSILNSTSTQKCHMTALRGKRVPLSISADHGLRQGGCAMAGPCFKGP